MTTRTNLFTHPSAEGVGITWTTILNSSTTSPSSAQAWIGSECYEWVTASNGHHEIITPTGTSGFPVTAGQPYAISNYIRSLAAVSSFVSLHWYNSAGTFLSSNIDAALVTSTSVWQRVQTIAVAPAGAAYAAVRMRLSSTGAATTVYLDGFLLEQVSEVGSYFDGDTAGGSWTATAHASPSTIPGPAAPSRNDKVRGIYTGVVTTAADPTVNFGGTPIAGDILLFTVVAGGNLESISAVSGCGATWTRLGGAVNYQYGIWIGIGATSGGTITATGAAYGNGKVARVHHLRGVEPFAVVQANSSSYKMRANENQVVVGYGYGTSTSIDQVNKLPGGVWVDQTEVVFPVGGNKFNTSYALPAGPTDYNLGGNSGGLIVVVGNPVHDAAVTAVNPFYNGGFEGTNSGWQSSNSSIAVSTTFSMFGVQSLRMTATGAVPNCTRGTSNPSANAVPGVEYTWSAYVRSVNARNGRLNIRWINQGGTFTTAVTGTTVALPAGTWVRLTVTGACPAGSYLSGPQIEITDGVSTDVFYIDGVKVEEGSSATDYFDGSVTTTDRINVDMPGPGYYSLQSEQPAAPDPSVVEVFIGAVTTAADPTVSVGSAPDLDDVLILSDARGNVGNAEATAVSGLGATWTKIGGGNNYQSFWLGTGATSSGTVTATATLATQGRNIRIHQLRGVSPDVYIQQWLSAYPVVATQNQIVLGSAYSQSVTSPFPFTMDPGLGWTIDTQTAFQVDRIHNTARIVPPFSNTYNATPNIYGVMIIVGSPVKGMTIKRRNLCGNPSFESGVGDYLGSGTTTRSRSLTTSAVGISSGTALYNANATAIIRKATGGNGPQGPATPGKTYTISCWVRCNNARDAGVVIMWLNLGQGIMTTGTYDTLTTLVANTWTRVSWTGTAPAGTFWVGPECKLTGCLAGDQYWWDGFLIEEGTTVGDFFDGSTPPPPGSDIQNRYVGINDLSQSVQLEPFINKVYSREGGAWVDRSGAVPKAWNGTEWVIKRPEYWNGSEWILL